MPAHRENVNSLLLQTSELVRTEARSKNYSHATNRKSLNRKSLNRRTDLIGADLRKTDLIGANLRGACLIAANLSDANLSGADLIGGDFRDTNICGANLAESLFLTQAQLNVAMGNMDTKLPPGLIAPAHWMKHEV